MPLYEVSQLTDHAKATAALAQKEAGIARLANHLEVLEGIYNELWRKHYDLTAQHSALRVKYAPKKEQDNG